MSLSLLLVSWLMKLLASSLKNGNFPFVKYEVMLMARAIKIQNVIFLFDNVGIGVIASSLANLDL